MDTISDLPDETLVNILKYLTPIESDALSVTSNRMRNVMYQNESEKLRQWNESVHWNQKYTPKTEITKARLELWQSLIDHPNIFHGHSYTFDIKQADKTLTLVSYIKYFKNRPILRAVFNENKDTVLVRTDNNKQWLEYHLDRLTMGTIPVSEYINDGKVVISYTDNSVIEDTNNKQRHIKYYDSNGYMTPEILSLPTFSDPNNPPRYGQLPTTIARKIVFEQFSVVRTNFHTLLNERYQFMISYQWVTYKKITHENDSKVISYYDNGRELSITLNQKNEVTTIGLINDEQTYNSERLKYKMIDNGYDVDIAIIFFDGIQLQSKRALFTKAPSFYLKSRYIA